MNVTLFKSLLNGSVDAISSKSYTHRYLIASMLSNNKSTISNVSFSNDILATLNCLASFGCDYKINGNNVTINNSNTIVYEPIFDCNESGSTLRFLIPVALTKYNKVIFKGTNRLIDRGISAYEEIFNKQDIKVNKYDNKIIIEGRLKSGEFLVDGNMSSQYITGLLFALPLLDGDSVITFKGKVNSFNYINITLDVLRKYHIDYKLTDKQIFIKGNQSYIANDHYVEGDYSNAAFLKAFNYLNCNITVNNLNPSSYQGDKVFEQYFEILKNENAILDISNCIDLGPILFAFAAIFNGATFKGTNRLKIKESDRATSMAIELAKINVKVDVLDDYVIVHKCEIKELKEPFYSHNDHRIVMALSIFSTLMDIKILDYQAVNKSYPSYFKDLESLGAKIIYETK